MVLGALPPVPESAFGLIPDATSADVPPWCSTSSCEPIGPHGLPSDNQQATPAGDARSVGGRRDRLWVGTTTTGPPTVNVSLTAPSYGAVVGVQDIDVVGLVAPNSAVVRVDRVRAHVANKGVFKSNLTLHPGMNRIRIVATAHGYKRTTVSVSLRYHPRRGG